MPESSDTSEPWYAAGLAFECTQCGNCCTGEPGTVRLTEVEADALAAHEELARTDFNTLRTRREQGTGALLLREYSDGSCVYWKAGAGCTVYKFRPLQCRTFPFWRGNVASQKHWQLAGTACPGIGRGEQRSLEVIEAVLVQDGTSGAVSELPETCD